MQDSDRQNSETIEIVLQKDNISISAWMDGDAETAIPDRVFTEAGQNAWRVYHLIGDTLRTPELIRPVSAQFHQRLASAIAAESSFSAPSSQQPTTSLVQSSAPASVQSVAEQPVKSMEPHHRSPLKTGWRLVWPGLAMAAAVASVVWMARPFFVPESGAPVQQMASVDPVGTQSPAIRDYVTAHRQIAGPTGVRQASFGASR